MGVRVAEHLRAPTPKAFHHQLAIPFLLVVFLSCIMLSFGAISPDAEALLMFKNSLSNNKALSSWKPETNPCDGNKAEWIGILCNVKGDVRGLQLENLGLKGTANLTSLLLLPIRTLSIMNNTFTGQIPDLKQLRRLRSVYLSYNHFSGKIPNGTFAGMRFLRKVFLKNNEFSGGIPSSLVDLPRLVVLRLDGNKFEGQIPDFQQHTLKRLNVSNNQLEGPIPTSLSHMESTSFSGNKNLCGTPLESCSPPNPTTLPPAPAAALDSAGKTKSDPTLKIVLIVLIVGLILAVLTAAFIIAHSTKSQNSQLQRTSTLNEVTTFVPPQGSNQADDPNKGPETNVHPKRSSESQSGKLSFLRDDRERFDLHDLLRASAEILGSGTFGSSYKATILSRALVVKRYKQMNSLGRVEFHEHMRRIGRLTHPNLLPLVAYYYRREEKLLVYDYIQNGSLAFHLHGNRSPDQPALDWPVRLRIIKGVAKGLTFLYHSIPSLIVPYGHLKSSNVVLDQSFEPLMTDYALLPVINLEHSQLIMMAYKSPEYAKLGRITKKTDVWSLGILILEILTGRYPENYLTQRYDPGFDLASWVNSMIADKKTSEVFDAEMEGASNSKGELLRLLKIGISCCEEDVERRLDLKEAVERIEMIHGGGSDGDFSPCVVREGSDGYSSREM
ncbi:hypothetical protein UlMin_041580 [Ulmus minor]